MNKSFSKTATIVVFGFLLIAVVAYFVMPTVDVSVNSRAKHSFTVDVPMTRARKILVRTNAAKKLLAMANVELLDQEWLKLKFDVNRPLIKRDWHVDGVGKMVVRTNDSYLGSHDITLDQSVDIRAEEVKVSSKLTQPSGPIAEYISELNLVPDDAENARFETSLELQVNTTANYFTRSTVESKIRAAAQSALEKQEDAIRSIIADQDGKLIIVPKIGSDSK